MTPIAIHESAHACTTIDLGMFSSIDTVTIVPTGDAAGHVKFWPSRINGEENWKRVVVLLAGGAALRCKGFADGLDGYDMVAARELAECVLDFKGTPTEIDELISQLESYARARATLLMPWIELTAAQLQRDGTLTGRQVRALRPSGC